MAALIVVLELILSGCQKDRPESEQTSTPETTTQGHTAGQASDAEKTPQDMTKK